ncbi:branched-chain amino acid transport system II carrier protein [Fructilactobacillus vespulae]|uniref:branched-chain amino acid transport system II carrier protein n=1 Tax=Fructilactobacillus vespulae TaxID=1249630 RepID=UPI0039B5D6D8
MKLKMKSNFKQHLLLSSLLFGLFFGAGNLIFPIHLGQISGENWLPAALGFVLSAVLLPLGSILALSITKSKSMYDLALPVGTTFSLLFLIFAHASMGLFIGSPRLATVSFTMGVKPFLPNNSWVHPALFIFSALFFSLIVYLAYNQNSIINSVGKFLNPLFIILLFSLFFIAFCLQGDLTKLPSIPVAGKGTGSFINGFLEGYNTMDALAGLGFGVTIITALKVFVKDEKKHAWSVAKVGFSALGLEALIYVLLIALGVASLSYTKISTDGGTAFTIIMNHYTGAFGAAVLAVLTFLACVTTALGVLQSFSQDLGNRFPKIGYHKFLVFSNLIAFGLANLGLDQIILFSLPVLVFLYPLAITLILLALCCKVIGKNKIIYRVTMTLVLIPATLDMFHSLPPMLHAPFTALDKWCVTNIPLFSMSLDFIPFMLTGFIGSVIYVKLFQKK